MKTANTSPRPAARLDLAAIRERLKGVRGQQYWRSLDEIAETAEFREMLQREFPDGASEWMASLDRRSFLKMAAASLALAGLSACTKQPSHRILPYVRQPANLTLGEPLYYATSMVLGGFATGVLAKSREGHPIKVDGSPEHPASLGGSSAWIQASILGLYDPDRSPSFVRDGEISTWAAFLSDLSRWTSAWEANHGAGLRLLAETVTSPTLAAQLDRLLKRFPKASLHQFDPIGRDNAREGAMLAFGQPLETQHHFDRAAVILSLDSDFLYTHPQRLRYTRDFVNARRVSDGRKEMSRLYVVEATPSVTGTMADHRMPLASGQIGAFALGLAGLLGAVAGKNSAPEGMDAGWSRALAEDLELHRGKSIIIAGEWQPPAVHALTHLLNDHLGNTGNTVYYTASAEARPERQMDSLRELTEQMKAGTVETLFILEGNPVYAAPADFGFAEGLSKVRRSVHLGLEYDETAVACAWHIPAAHYLESWGDARSFDGIVSMMQPLIAPLYGGKSAYELLDAIVFQQALRSDYEIVREHWKLQNPSDDFEENWRKALCDGFIAGSAFPESRVTPRRAAIPDAASPSEPANLEVLFRPDPCIWDGRFANNGWLQECAKPINKLTWDNAVIVSPGLAQRQQLATDDVVEVTLNGRTIRGPVWVMPGQAENSITLHLGYGRRQVGRVGAGVGFDAYALRESGSFWRGAGATIKKTDERRHLVSTQAHHNVDGAERQVHREGTLAQFLRDAEFVKKMVEVPPDADTLYYPGQFKFDGYKWAMSIDLSACIGCNACLIACEAENNIPVVGREQVNVHREMYWIRIDTYHRGPLENPQFNHMPVPCMQCEHAPCELVCPVEATVHDHEGLNLMIYNRCVGTRFCSNNCPYKVRRFNFLRYGHYDSPANTSLPSYGPMYNPEVTVRWRGVMEKCTYCVQRIASARITAEKENRRIQDGEVRTACQDACPARAIVFGDLNGSPSRVARLREHPLEYAMLGEINTRPRTTYLAKLRNPNPHIKNEG